MSPAAPYTYLFVPGNRPDRFAKAAASDADRVILDLEDAVATADKAEARISIQAWMQAVSGDLEPQRLMIRINDARSADFEDDLSLLSRLPACGVMLSKSERVEDLQAVRAVMRPDTELIALIETGVGVLAASQLARQSGLTRLALGALDLMVDLNIPSDSPTLAHSASKLVLASRAAGLASPIAGVTPSVSQDQTEQEMQEAFRMGFGAKLCIHPTQLAGVRRALAPQPADLQWAQTVVAAWEAAHASGEPAGALQLDGKMVDRPVYLHALRLLALQRASQSGG
jgi:citrate lyase subunit beta/citryl-CoA lyase